MVTDRRAYPRTLCHRPVKLQTGAGGRYFAGRTRDLSAGGALIQLTSPARVIAGDHLRIGFAADNQPLVASTDLVSAVVVRAFDADSGRYLAVSFSQSQPALVSTTAAPPLPAAAA